MKKIILQLIFLFTIISVVSCEKGKWDDNIKLSSKEVVFNSLQQSKTITTQSTNWWLGGISLDGVNVDFTNIDRLSKNWIITQPEFQIERADDGKKIIISMNPNNTSSDRTVLISLQSGDYFDHIKVIQKK